MAQLKLASSASQAVVEDRGGCRKEHGDVLMQETTISISSLPSAVRAVLERTAVLDIHTHLFDPSMGSMLLWGVDEMLTYHYLAAELFRARPDLDCETYWRLPPAARADLAWQELFVRRAPVSEVCTGALTVFQALGLDPNAETLQEARAFFRGVRLEQHVDRVLRLAGVERLCMTNDPLDPDEQTAWASGFPRDARFLAAVRLDSSLLGWPGAVPRLRAMGYDVEEALSGMTMAEIRRFLEETCVRMDAQYFALSLPPEFSYPEPQSPAVNLLTHAVAPVARQLKRPVALMIGARRGANPALRLAGDSVGTADLTALERLVCDFGDVRWLVTTLARENTHALCVAARKFKNLTPFGCWWFMNNPSLIRETTRMRLEMLGFTFVAQHSDARVLEHLIYKWSHARKIIAEVLTERYAALLETGRRVTTADLERDARALFDGGLVAPDGRAE